MYVLHWCLFAASNTTPDGHVGSTNWGTLNQACLVPIRQSVTCSLGGHNSDIMLTTGMPDAGVLRTSSIGFCWNPLGKQAPVWTDASSSTRQMNHEPAPT